MTASQMRIAETIDAFYGDAGAKDGVSRSYKQAVEDLDTETIKALDGPYRTTVLDPISRFCAYFPDVNECTDPHLSYAFAPSPTLYYTQGLICEGRRNSRSIDIKLLTAHAHMCSRH